MIKPKYEKPILLDLAAGVFSPVCGSGTGANGSGGNAYMCEAGGSEAASNACESGDGNTSDSCGNGGDPWYSQCFGGAVANGSACQSGATVTGAPCNPGAGD
jgi:hypothetical protein